MKFAQFGRIGLYVAAVGLGLASFTSQVSAAPAYTDSSTGPTQNQVTKEATDLVTGIISDRINSNTSGGDQASLGGQTGMAAGGAALTKGLWFNMAMTDIDDDHVGANYDGPIYTALLGYDTKVGDNLLLGLAVGYERIDIDTTFNGGTVDSDAWTIAPYLSYDINDMLSVNAAAGYTWASYDLTHSTSAIGSTDGERWFASTNLVARQSMGQWRLTETLGYFYVTETQDAYIETGVGALAVPESTSHLGQLRIGGKLGYEIATSFGYMTPYVSGRAEFDLSKSADPVLATGATVGYDDSGATFGTGVKAGIGEAMTLSLDLTTTAFRSDYEARMVSGTVTFNF